MLAKITDTNPVGHLGFDITLKHLSIALDNFSFVGVIVPKYQLSPPALSLLLVSGSRSWSFPCHFQEGNYIIQGEISTKESKNGKYKSVTIKMAVLSVEQVITHYESVKHIEGIISL